MQQFIRCLFSILLCLPLVGSGQTVKAYEKAGDESMDAQDYFSAYSYYETALSLDSTLQRVRYKFGKAAYYWQSYEEANEAFQRIDNRTNRKSFPTFEYDWALAKIAVGAYDEAIVLLKQLLKKGGLPQTLRTKAKNKLAACQNANKIVQKPVEVTIKPLGEAVNSPYSEFGAVEKGEILYFSALKFKDKSKRQEQYFSKIMTLDNDEKASVAKEKLNETDIHNANTSFSADGRWLYFTRCTNLKTGGIRCNIYRRDLSQKHPEDKLLPTQINQEGTTSTHPCIAFDTVQQVERLFFVSDRAGGQGGLDIWQSEIKDGKFGDPTNLGKKINTAGDEITPFFHHGEQTLYFSSDEWRGLGGFDVFQTKLNSRTWATPKNIGFPLNSSYNDTYFSLNSDGVKGYFSSNRKGAKTLTKNACCYDIFAFTLKKETPVVPPISPQDTLIVITETDTLPDVASNGEFPFNDQPIEPIPTIQEPFNERIKDLLPIALFFDNDQPNPRTRATTTTMTYSQTYSAYYARKAVFQQKYAAPLANADKAQAQEKVGDFFEMEVKGGFDKLHLVADLLLAELAKGHAMTIFIKGFTSPLASSDYNENLSKRRIASVFNELKTYQSGALLVYMDNNQLKVEEVPFGETQTEQGVSDDSSDKRKSVYSVGASRERRVEIIDITQ